MASSYRRKALWQVAKKKSQSQTVIASEVFIFVIIMNLYVGIMCISLYYASKKENVCVNTKAINLCHAFLHIPCMR